MNASTLLKQMVSDGVQLTLSESGSIRTTGDSATVHRWLPTIREHKPEIVEALQRGATIKEVPEPFTAGWSASSTAIRWK
jgi:hypothetical protein